MLRRLLFCGAGLTGAIVVIAMVGFTDFFAAIGVTTLGTLLLLWYMFKKLGWHIEINDIKEK